jgi:signal transduction histidine kinase
MVRAYLKKQRLILVLIAVMNTIFAIISGLNGLAWDVVGYGVILTSTFGVVILLYDFWHYHEKQRILQIQLTRITLSVEGLPTAFDAIEESYQQLIHALYAEMRAVATKADVANSELESNYTIWAHQIKNPIAAMRLVFQTNPSPVNRDLLNELIKIEQYVEMVLQLVRVNTISTDYVFRFCDVDEMIRSVLRKYASMFISKDLTLMYEPLEVSVVTDEKWLTFVIEQVISNALKYTPTGQITISLSAANEIVISDTGIGIDAADLPRVCEKGYTGFNGRFEQTSTGIGLFLVKRILTKLGHSFRIESTIGVGTQVYIGLNRVKIVTD